MNTYSGFSFNLASAFLQNHVKKSACVSPVSLLLPLAAVFAIYFYLVKKGPRYTTILLSIVALSVVCSLLGVL